MSITEQTQQELETWISQMNKANKFLATSRQEKIFEFLNRRENLCTPGFLLRRQLQLKFSPIIKKAADVAGIETYADLTVSGNKPWPTNLIECLAAILADTSFKNYGQAPPDIEKKQWQNYLLDAARCQRKTAVKLIFALEMDEVTASKFLLASGNDLLSLRNPFDYACKACLDCGLSYEDAEKLFDAFSSQRDTENTATQNLSDDFTKSVKNETATFKNLDMLSSDTTRKNLLTLMLRYKNDFREDRQAAGYSLRNMKRLQVFLRYLLMLYPTVEAFFDKDILETVAIETKADGTPKILRQLVSSMFDAHEIDLPEYTELTAYGGSTLPERGSLKRFHDNIPFNKNVLIPLKSLSKTLRSIMRAIEYPKNARAVNRDTILLLTYFFVAAWSCAEPQVKEKIHSSLENDMMSVEEDSPEETLLFALDDVAYAVDSLDESNELPIKIHVSALNRMLSTFDFNEFYAPFVLDRFILICLLSHESHLMSLVICESYRLSKKIIDENLGDKDGRM